MIQISKRKENKKKNLTNNKAPREVNLMLRTQTTKRSRMKNQQERIIILYKAIIVKTPHVLRSLSLGKTNQLQESPSSQQRSILTNNRSNRKKNLQIGKNLKTKEWRFLQVMNLWKVSLLEWIKLQLKRLVIKVKLN